ncbi:MAG: hypothetical protein ACRDRL_17805 [Sciscionella sp.]
MRTIQDLAVLLELIRRGESLVLDDRVSFQYRRHAASASSSDAFTGVRFAEERRFFMDAAQRMERLGWRRAARAARWHLSSRLHALSLAPATLCRGDVRAAAMLLEHAIRVRDYAR